MNEKTISRNYIKDNHSNIVEMNVIGIKEIYKENNKKYIGF
ncbi:MAG: hypothetical protein U0354_11915 [Candidatus Sericytochromatia bacterium]